MNKYPGRITKKEAKKLWQDGKPFIMIPCQCYPYSCNPMGVILRYRLSEFALEVKRNEWADGTEFEKLCNRFTYYNCNAVLGYYPAFYTVNPTTYDREKETEDYD